MNSMQGGSGYGATGQNAGGYSNPQMKMGKTPSGYNRYQKYTPGQADIFNRNQQLVGPDSYLSRLAGGDQDLFNEIEAPAMRQFSGTLGGIASRFSGGGGGPGALSGRRSSGFQNESTSAASNFAQELQANRQNLMQQAIQGLHGMSQDLLGNEPYGLAEKRAPKQSGWQSILGGAAPVLGAAGGFLAGGPAGAIGGWNAGQSFSNALNG